jgi:hypothetical protein
MSVSSIETILSFSKAGDILHVDTRNIACDTIDVTVMNSLAETISRMKLISGEHFISLASLAKGSYSIRLVAGNNVWVNTIIIQHL